jgi:dimethylargininase
VTHRFTRAIARLPAETFADGLTTVSLGAPEFKNVLLHHIAYVEALRKTGVDVTVLDSNPAFPDSTFVEDTAIVADGRAIITRPGAASRAGETDGIAQTLRMFFDELDTIEPPGTLDGGDVCEAEGRVYVGLSHRTNREGAEQLGAWLKRSGLPLTVVDIRDLDEILHFKSGIAHVGDDTFVAIEALRSRVELPGRVIVPTAEENYASNCVRVNDTVLFPLGYPRLQEALERAGFSLTLLDVSEYQKMDGGLSCLSIRF